MPALIISTAVAIIIGGILLVLLSGLIGRVQFSFSTAFWCSFIAHIFISFISLIIGWFFAYHMGAGLLIGLVIGWLFLTVLLQIAVRAKSGTLSGGRAAILSFMVIAADFFIASPISAFIQNLISTSH